jgi:hypothetical protein
LTHHSTGSRFRCRGSASLVASHSRSRERGRLARGRSWRGASCVITRAPACNAGGVGLATLCDSCWDGEGDASSERGAEGCCCCALDGAEAVVLLV